MITLKPQHSDIPDDVLIRAHDFGNTCLLQRSIKSDMAVAKKGGFFYFQCNVDKDWAQVTILDFTGNFLAHPRSGNLRKIPYTSNNPDRQYLTSVFHGGYSELGNEQMTNELGEKWSYPLIDDDKATFIFNVDDISAEWTNAENYGNVWWVGTDDTLTWRGPSNRHFPLASDIHIPGFTQMENLIEGGTSLTVAYTAFSNKIYKDGAVFARVPEMTSEDLTTSLVVGACYYKSVLLCMTVSSFGEAFWFQVWKLVENKWVEIGSKFSTSRATTPCFINKLGNMFVFLDKLYLIEDNLESYSEVSTVPEDTSGSKNISGEVGYGNSYSFSGATQNVWPELVDDKLEYTTVTSSGSFTTTTLGDSEGNTTKIDMPVYFGNYATTAQIVRTGDELNVITNGAYCSISWEGVDTSAGGAAIKNAICDGVNAKATVNPQGIIAGYVIEANAEPLAITGPDYWTGNIGDYTITGGKGARTILPPSGCGMSSITVSDECGGSVDKSVRMPNGSYYVTSIESAVLSGFIYDSFGGIISECTTCNESQSTCFVGDTRSCCIFGGSACSNSSGATPTTYTDAPTSQGCSLPFGNTISSLGTCDCISGETTTAGIVNSRSTYAWGCVGQYVFVGTTLDLIDTTYSTGVIKKTTYNYTEA